MSFADLKKNRQSSLQNLQNKVKQSGEQGGGNRDPRKWKLTYDKSTKVGSAIIRFLPFGNGERLPWAEWIEHSFKGKGGSYWNRSLKTIGQDDPIQELNSAQWERNQGNDQDEVKKRGRRFRYISNIVVVNDPAHPENNGKVFLFEYGPSIHKKIMAAMVPEYEDQSPCNVFDMWEGANFRYRSKDKAGYVNYDDSTFDPAGELHQDNNVLEVFYNGMHDLTEFEKEEAPNYKSYEDLDKEMRKVLGGAYVAGIHGESYGAGDAAGAGENPFANQQAPQGGGQQQAPQHGADPFANQQQAPQGQGADPFATQNQQDDLAASQHGADPFANQNQQQAPQNGADPFAGAQDAGAAGEDPFANMDLS